MLLQYETRERSCGKVMIWDTQEERHNVKCVVLEFGCFLYSRVNEAFDYSFCIFTAPPHEFLCIHDGSQQVEHNSRK